jgi:hypothetical protein
MISRLILAAFVTFAVYSTASRAQEPPSQPVEWRGLAFSMAAHGAASGFDAWTSWQRIERNRFLADDGRFTANSAGKKAVWFAGVTAIETLVVKKWGRKHPWVVRAIRVGNYTSAGMLVSAGVRNLRSR